MTKISDQLVRQFFRFHNELKLYHWRTEKYSRHKASDFLNSKMQDLVDQFIESFMGAHGRVQLSKTEDMIIRTFTDKNVHIMLDEMVAFLTSLDTPLRKEPSLLNIRDEMVSLLTQTLYLFTLD